MKLYSEVFHLSLEEVASDAYSRRRILFIAYLLIIASSYRGIIVIPKFFEFYFLIHLYVI